MYLLPLYFHNLKKLILRYCVWFNSLPGANWYWNKAHPTRLHQNDKRSEADSFLKKRLSEKAGLGYLQNERLSERYKITQTNRPPHYLLSLTIV